MQKEILLLGDPRLYEISDSVDPAELTALPEVVQDLNDTRWAGRLPLLR
jgi:hypothetical protein